jgi:hypothetical protein
MARTYLVSLSIEVDERADHPANWDWPTLLDTPYGVEVVYTAELAPVDQFSPEDEIVVPVAQQ